MPNLDKLGDLGVGLRLVKEEMDKLECDMISERMDHFDVLFYRYELAQNIFARLWRSMFPNGWYDILVYGTTVQKFINEYRVEINDAGQVAVRDRDTMKGIITKKIYTKFELHKRLAKLNHLLSTNNESTDSDKENATEDTHRTFVRQQRVVLAPYDNRLA